MILVGTIGGAPALRAAVRPLPGLGPAARGMTIVMYLYQIGFMTGDIGYAAAVGWILVVLILGVSRRAGASCTGSRRSSSMRRRSAAAVALGRCTRCCSTPSWPAVGAARCPFLWLICATFKRQKDIFTYAFLPWDHLGRPHARQLPRPVHARAVRAVDVQLAVPRVAAHGAGRHAQQPRRVRAGEVPLRAASGR